MIMILQADPVSGKFLEYGLLGALVVALFFVVRYLYLESKKDTQIWKDMALKSQENYITISIEQNKTNQKLIEIRQKDVEEAKEFRAEVTQRLNELPERILKELHYQNFKMLYVSLILNVFCMEDVSFELKKLMLFLDILKEL